MVEGWEYLRRLQALSVRFLLRRAGNDHNLERISGKRDVEYGEFVVMERRQEKKAYSLILDASGWGP